MLRRNTPALPLHIVLLLVALFNALAGAPLHEARHIQELVRSATVSASAGDVDALTNNATASDEHSEETHTTCAWCLTHALEAGRAAAPAPPPPTPPAPPRRPQRHCAAQRKPLHGPAGALAVCCTRSSASPAGLTRVRPQPACAFQRIPFSLSPLHSPPD